MAIKLNRKGEVILDNITLGTYKVTNVKKTFGTHDKSGNKLVPVIYTAKIGKREFFEFSRKDLIREIENNI
jgi:hypothetical protein